MILYLAVQLGIGYWVSRSVTSDADYFVGGRRLGLPLASISMFATWFGAETCMGSSAAIFSHGLGGSRADPFGYTLCLVFFGLLLAGQLRQLKLTTLGDFYGLRYSKAVEKLAVLIMIPTSLMWAGAQIRAFGQILAVVSPIDPVISISIAALFVVCYTSLGGLMGDVITDVLQGGVLVIGLIILLAAGVMTLGGPAAAVASIRPEQLRLVLPDETLWQRLDIWAVPVLGSLVAQEMVSRTLATRTPTIARNASLVAAALYLSVGLIPVAIGLLGSSLMSEAGHVDQFLPMLAAKHLSPALFVVFIGALVSAILSTVDSTILAISAFVTHNLMGDSFKKWNEPKKLRVSRALVALTGFSAYILAISTESIYDLVQNASAFGSAGVFIVTMVGMWWKGRGGPVAASGCLIVGVLATLGFNWIWTVEAPYLAAMGLSALTYVSLALWERPVRLAAL